MISYRTTAMVKIIIQIVVLLSLMTAVTPLKCWHCFAGDCTKNLKANYQATKQTCQLGQTCQKVYFEMIEESDSGNKIHVSTVRSCSWNCEPRDDFLNCTTRRHNSRGCVRKDCCSDHNLCNHVTRIGSHGIVYILSLLHVICSIPLYIL